MGNTLGVYVTYFSWPSQQSADSAGRDKKNVVEMAKGGVTEGKECGENVVTKRELRRRRRLGAEFKI